MEKSVNYLILEQVEDIVSTIKSGKEYREYVELSKKLKKNERVMKKVEELKALQKEIVKKKANRENVENLEKQLANYLEELDMIPLYTEFIAKQQELNELYQMIKKRLDDYFYEKLNG